LYRNANVWHGGVVHVLVGVWDAVVACEVVWNVGRTYADGRPDSPNGKEELLECVMGGWAVSST